MLDVVGLDLRMIALTGTSILKIVLQTLLNFIIAVIIHPPH